MVKPGRKGSSKRTRASQLSVPKASKIVGGVELSIHKRICEIVATSPRTRPPPPLTPTYDPYVALSSSTIPQVGGLQPARRCVYGELPANTTPTRATFPPSIKARAESTVRRCSGPFVPSLSASPSPSPTVTPAPRGPRKSTLPAKPSPLCRSWVLGKHGLKPPSPRRRAQPNPTIGRDPVQISSPAYVPAVPSYLPPGAISTAVEQPSDPSDVAMFDLQDWDVEMMDLNQAKGAICDEETRLSTSLESPLVIPDASASTRWLPNLPSTLPPVQPQQPPPSPTSCPIPTLQADSPSSYSQEQTTSYALPEPRRFDPNFLAHMGASSSTQPDRPPVIIGQRPQDIQREIRKSQRQVVPSTGHVEPNPPRSLQSLIAEVRFHQEPVPTARESPEGLRAHPRPFRSVQPQAYISSSSTSSPPLYPPRVHTFRGSLDQERDAIYRASLKRKAAFGYECDSWQHPLVNWIDMSTIGTTIGEGATAKKRRTCVSEYSDQVSYLSLVHFLKADTVIFVVGSERINASTSNSTASDSTQK